MLSFRSTIPTTTTSQRWPLPSPASMVCVVSDQWRRSWDSLNVSLEVTQVVKQISWIYSLIAEKTLEYIESLQQIKWWGQEHWVNIWYSSVWPPGVPEFHALVGNEAAEELRCSMGDALRTSQALKKCFTRMMNCEKKVFVDQLNMLVKRVTEEGENMKKLLI